MDDDSSRTGGEAGPLLYRGLFENAPVEVHIWKVVRDDQGRITTWRLVDANAEALRSWDMVLDDVRGKTVDEMFPGAGATETFMPIVRRVMDTGEPYEWERDFPMTLQILRMVSYRVGENFVSTGFDVSDRVLRERQLNEALDSLRQVIRDGGVGLWDWDLATDEVHFSDEWKRQLGYASDEVEGAYEEWQRRVHPDDLKPTLAVIRNSIAAASTNHETVVRMLHKDGSYRWILAQASLVLDDEGKPARMRGSHIDVTDRKRLEDQVLAAQKLEAVGTLAAGIAHDFNNLLTAITGNLSLLENSAGRDAEETEILEDVACAAQRAEALTAQLLTFAKGGAPVRETAAIRELLIDTTRFVTRGSAVHCEFALADDLAAVDADVGQLSQVINNLVLNARQAMADGGKLRVAATNVVLMADNPHGLDAGPYVEITVTDDGPGIPDDVLNRVFDPFFSTKAQGSGLGLSTSFSIVAAHGGRLIAVSDPGRGATFFVYLPAAKISARPSPPKHAVASGSGRILVMDDNDAVRRSLTRMLERLGYGCDAVENGTDAIAYYRRAQSDGPYAAVILDLTIPGGLGGKVVLQELRALDPAVVALVTSGYAEDDVMANYDAHGFQGRLRKPLDVATLSTELRRSLGED